MKRIMMGDEPELVELCDRYGVNLDSVRTIDISSEAVTFECYVHTKYRPELTVDDYMLTEALTFQVSDN